MSQIVLFSDLTRPELHEIDRTFEEEFFDEGRKVLRKGIQGSNFFVIVDGEAGLHVDGTERFRLARGDHFGEAPILLAQAPAFDVVALTSLRCRVLPGDRLESFLIEHPRVLFRMLQNEVQRMESWLGSQH